jgi:hypothetical protein
MVVVLQRNLLLVSNLQIFLEQEVRAVVVAPRLPYLALPTQPLLVAHLGLMI